MSTVTKFVNNSFGGIRRKNSSFSTELITCSDCQNVELFFTKLNSGVGIRTASGNKSVTRYTNDNEEVVSLIPDDEEVVGLFETIQDGLSFTIAYTVTTHVSLVNEGKLYHLDLANHTKTLLVDSLSPIKKACGTDYAQGMTRDFFIFSNSEEVVYIYSDLENHTHLQIEDAENIHLIDEEGNDVKGLGFVVFDSRLWIFNGKTLWYSQKAECRNFTPPESEYTTNPGYIEFVKNVTAIAPYLGSLAVFHKDSSCLITLNETTGFAQGDESPGGCAGYGALVFHGTDLYFYDDTKKGVFSFQQVVNGDKTLGDNIAVDLQEELTLISSNLDSIKALSVVTEDRNEVWFITPIVDTYDIEVTSGDTTTTVTKPATIVLIFDYIRGEWVKRKCQKINTVAIIEGKLYSAGKEVCEEYKGFNFDGDFIDSYYTCSTFNLGEDNTMKITKFPPRITVDGNKTCDFFVRYVKNYQPAKNSKEKRVYSAQEPLYARYNQGFLYNRGYLYRKRIPNVVVKIPSVTFKALEMKFYTKTDRNGFAIKAIEFSKLKVKQV